MQHQTSLEARLAELELLLQTLNSRTEVKHTLYLLQLQLRDLFSHVLGFRNDLFLLQRNYSSHSSNCVSILFSIKGNPSDTADSSTGPCQVHILNKSPANVVVLGTSCLSINVRSWLLLCSVGVSQETHAALLSEVQRLEAELGRIRGDLQGVMGCQGKCDRLDTIHETVCSVYTADNALVLLQFSLIYTLISSPGVGTGEKRVVCSVVRP